MGKEEVDLNVNVKTKAGAADFKKFRKQIEGTAKATKKASGAAGNSVKGKHVDVWKNMTKKGFQATGALLGVMFASMAASNAIGGLLQPALDLAGVFDVWSALLGVFFLPAALLLLDAMFWLYDIFDSLPEPIKLVINYMTLFGLGIFMVLGFLAQLGIFLIAINATLGLFGMKLVTVLGGITAFIAGLGVGPLLVFLAALIVIGVAFDKVVETLGKLGTGVATMFSGLLTAVIGFNQIILGLIFLNFDLISTGFKNLLGGLTAALAGWVLVVFSYVLGLPIIFWTAFSRIIDYMTTTFAPSLKKPWEDLKVYIQGLVKWMEDILTGMNNAVSAIKFNQKTGIFGMGNFLGYFQEGGYVPSNGLAFLHRGEYVVPANQTMNSFSPSIVVNASIASDYDVKRLGDELSRYWGSDMNRRR